MAGKFQGPFLDPLITNQSMAASFNGTPINLETKDNVGIQLSWTGANPIGAINVQVSVDYNPQFKTGTWTLLANSANTPIEIDPGGGAGTGYFDLNQLSAQWVQVVYTTAGGSVGLLTSKTVAKAV